MKGFDDTLRLAYEQMQEDRMTIKASYAKFAEQMESLNDYMANGMNINKCLELLTKQTAQLLELAKLQGAGKKSPNEEIEVQDKEDIYKALSGPDGYQ